MSEEFANPNVPINATKVVKRIAKEECPTEPWNILNKSVEQGIERKNARKVLRRMRLSNKIVPTGNFTGEVKFVGDV